MINFYVIKFEKEQLSWKVNPLCSMLVSWASFCVNNTISSKLLRWERNPEWHFCFWYSVYMLCELSILLHMEYNSIFWFLFLRELLLISSKLTLLLSYCLLFHFFFTSFRFYYFHFTVFRKCKFRRKISCQYVCGSNENCAMFQEIKH